MYGVSHREEAAFAEIRAKIAKDVGCAISAVTCEGCQQMTERCWSNECKVMLCLEERGYRYCDKCTDIGECGKFGDLNERYGGLQESMSRLRDVGDEHWLAEKRKERTCPQCGGILYYFDGNTCLVCKTIENG
ncbi:MAG: DUF3795 domain-containing protein [bacterium]|nr:DUF3795 domain-containing protein [bacterium]